MTTIKTNWLTKFYDPLAAPAIVEKAWEFGEPRHHLVYAAMLDGVRGKDAISDYTRIGATQVIEILHDLASAGYVRLGKYNSKVCYVLAEEPNSYYKPALTPEEVQEMGILVATLGYTHADLAKHLGVKRWVISDAMQGRKQFSESRV